jgi:hypothetical protein
MTVPETEQASRSTRGPSRRHTKPVAKPLQVQLAKGIATSGSHLREVTTNAEAPEASDHLAFDLGPRPAVVL